MKPQWLEFVDHTADEYIRVTGADLPQLLERLAWAMFSLLTDMECIRPQKRWRIAVEADDPESLVVRWLSELNVLHQTDHVLLSEFDVSVSGKTALEAVVRGETIDHERHDIFTEIKAVTYHGLDITRCGDRLVASVIFDM
jgi:SHS2 domain-containing protein